ncbi:MAG: hypothetical protein ACREDO_11545 [Methyloceanibacter sp.]
MIDIGLYLPVAIPATFHTPSTRRSIHPPELVEEVCRLIFAIDPTSSRSASCS